MQCPRCGSQMVEHPPGKIYMTDPPQYRRIMYCGCGYSEDQGVVFDRPVREQLHEKWKEANRAGWAGERR